MDEFIQGDGTLRVREQDGRYRPVPTPVGYSDHAFRNVVAATDTLFRLNGKFPSVSEVQKLWPKATAQTISGLFLTDEFKQAMEYRGVTADVDSGLSMEQQMVLLKLTDFTDRRSTTAKLKDMGVPMPRYQAWMKQPLFAEMYRQRTEDQFKDASTLALNKLMANMEMGDQRAVEKVLEITGRYNPANQQLEDVRTILVRIVEAIIRNVPDPEQRRAIMNDISSVTMSYEVLNRTTEVDR